MEVLINSFDDLGNGLTKINNKVCFVKYGLPNELINIEIIKDKKSYSEGKITSINKKSDMRIEPICKYYYKCGGCNFLHVKNKEEMEFKKNKVINYFGKLDGFYETLEYNYRNKVVLHIEKGKIGFYKEKTNNLVEVDYCYLVKDKINEIIKLIKSYSNNSFSGKVTIRVNIQDESMVIFDGCFNNINILSKEKLINNLIYNDKVIKGNNYFYEIVNGYKFKVHYKSFFQVNIKGLENIVNILTIFFQDKKIDKVLELFSGTSVLGIFISNFVGNVISIESNINATNDAKENIKINNICNLNVINGLVEDNIDNFHDIDLILVDPARRGLIDKTINNLKRIKSKYLIYIACGIDSLKRDLKLLSDIYQIDKIYGIDMFPCTNNIECLALLSLKK